MAIYPIYATSDDLAQYLATTIGQLPTDVNRLLTRASELIYGLIKDTIELPYIPTTLMARYNEAAKLATCAQVEYWMEVSEGISTNSGIKSTSIGSFSVTFAGDSSSQQLATRARNYLNDQGLMYKGRVYCGSRVPYESDLHN